MAEFLSSHARLAKFFQKSRDAWKARSLENQKRILVLDGKVRDLQRSREKWKADAKKLKQGIGGVAETIDHSPTHPLPTRV